MSVLCQPPQSKLATPASHQRAQSAGHVGGVAPRARRYTGPAVSMVAPPPSGSNQRQHHRQSSQTRATFWREGMARNGACVIRDMSVSGARLEFGPRATSEMGAQLAVGDWLTLWFETALEQTTATCQVVWVSGARCGVRYQGQFSTSAKPTTRRPAGKAKPVKKSGWLGAIR